MRAVIYKITQHHYQAYTLDMQVAGGKDMTKSVQELPDNWDRSVIETLNNIRNSKED